MSLFSLVSSYVIKQCSKPKAISSYCGPSFCTLAVAKCWGGELTNRHIAAFDGRRWKSRKPKGGSKSPVTEDDSDDSDEEDNAIAGKGVEVKTSVVGSMRADLLLKVGLGLARNKVEEAFYESRIRINAKKIFKKSVTVHVGDEVDLIKGTSPTNPLFITVGRIEVLDAKAREDGESIQVKMRRSKSLIIENYPDGDPWKQTESVVAP